MVPYFSGNFQVFKDLALWVALVYDTQSNNSQYNNAQFMIYKLNIFIFLCISSRYSLHPQVLYEIDFSSNYAKLVAKSLFI